MHIKQEFPKPRTLATLFILNFCNKVGGKTPERSAPSYSLTKPALQSKEKTTHSIYR